MAPCRIERPTVIFILSAPYSGSTWLNTVLGSHGWATNVGEYHRPFTSPGHIACRLCEADGLAHCSVFHGIENIAARDAFHFASHRTGKSVVIDASKRLDWASRFSGRDDLDAKYIHLRRHPGGFADSYMRRHKGVSLSDLLAKWDRLNEDIEHVISASGTASYTAIYDELADKPDRTFPELCRFIGGDWNPAALEYWRVAHHGLGGNGAASVYLRNRKVRAYETADDAFYDGISDRPTAADGRWKVRYPDHALKGSAAELHFAAWRERCWLPALS